jgi:hypothetical protein
MVVTFRGISIAILTGLRCVMSGLRFSPSQSRRLITLLILIGVEIACSAYMWDRIQPQVSIGFLSKNGNEFILGWRESGNQFQYQAWPTVASALHYARENLHLIQGRTLRPDLTVENVWTDEQFGNYVVKWKTESLPEIHQMSFQNDAEAETFAQAFRAGSYTPSPVGHSILLLPMKN